MLRRSRALVHVSAPRTAPTGAEKANQSAGVDKLLLGVITERKLAETREPLELVYWFVQSCLLVRRLLCDTHGFSANDALRVKTRSAGAPAVSGSGLFIHPTVTLQPS